MAQPKKPEEKTSKNSEKTSASSTTPGKPEKKEKERPSRPERSGNPAKAAAAEKKRQEESRAAANRVSRVPVKVKSTGSPRWYAPAMVTVMVIGLLWVVATYIFKSRYPLPYFVNHHASDWLSNGNLYVGFLILMVGFLGLLRWK